MNVVRAIIFVWIWSYVYGRSDAIDRHGTSVHMVSSCESVVYEGKQLLSLVDIICLVTAFVTKMGY